MELILEESENSLLNEPMSRMSTIHVSGSAFFGFTQEHKFVDRFKSSEHVHPY